MKFDMNKLHLKWRIFGFLCGFCALLLVILWLFQIVFLDSFYQNIKVTEIKKYANTIAGNIDNKNISDLITRISENGDVYIEISALDGTSIQSSSDTRYKISLMDKIYMISNARNYNNEYYKRITILPPQKPEMDGNFIGKIPPNNMQQGQSLVYARIVKSSSGKDVAVLISAVISPVNATVTTLRYQLYFITGIMLLLSILLALIIAKKISKPIEEINKSAKVLAEGNYNTHFDGKGFLEVGELSNTLNTAAVELSKVEDLRRELLANVSHDLRTPLSLIYSYAEMMHDFPNEVTPEQTQIIMDEAQRLTTLVNDLLDISKFESGIQELKLSEFNLTKSLESTVQRIKELVKKDGYSLKFIYDREAFVYADEVRITQAFYNLLINSIHYTGQDKMITVRQSVFDENVKIEVIDTGEGIASENLPYIWDRYYKIDKKHKRAIMGTGLGLSIVKKVMELHGSDYGVESTFGKGSIFWFTLHISHK